MAWGGVCPADRRGACMLAVARDIASPGWVMAGSLSGRFFKRSCRVVLWHDPMDVPPKGGDSLMPGLVVWARAHKRSQRFAL